jgi:tellurite resistance protein TerC
MTSVASPLVWALFAAVVVVALAVDLGLFHRESRVVTMKEATLWTVVWALLALAFNAFVQRRFGTEKALQFMQGWLLEWALSVDNVFVFLVIFRFFQVPAQHLHRVLFWGIIGAVVARGLFIAAGGAIIQRFHWVMYALGAFLVYTGAKILFGKEGEFDPSKSTALRVFRRIIPTSSEYAGQKFLIRREGRLVATPLLMVLVIVDVADVMFAVDSIPAIFGVTTDVFIVFTSNVFAILGLRSLFFLIEALVQRLRFLKVGVAIILAFIGAKILAERFFTIPVGLSLGVVAGVLLLSGLASVLIPPAAKAE